MNLNEAIGHASTLFMPEFLFGMDDDLLEGERAINEEALHLLIEEYFSNPNPSFGFDLVLDLADRNRSISDMMPPETVGGDRSRSRNLPSGLSDADILRGIATMQHRRVETLEKEVAGMNARKLLKSLRITGAVSASVKDPMWKYLWVKNNEPENFAKARWWLDVKEYLIARMTGNFVMTRDSAFSTLLYDTRNGKECWSRELCSTFGVDISHLPPVIDVTDTAGTLRGEQAAQLGLAEGTPVFGGGGDASLIGIGSGCVDTGDTHIYCGTSGWVSTIVDKQYVDTSTMMASIVGAQRGKYNYFAEMETAGKSLEWVKDHLALDEIGVYLEENDITGSREHIYSSLYEYMSEVIERCPPGSGGVIFTPWLHGNRCPFEDHNATGIFFGLTLDTGKTEMIRAVTEGVCFHMRWMLECQDRKIHTGSTIRFCGGGALSDVTSQILADITGRRIEVPDSPQNTGSAGAALTAATGLGLLPDIKTAGKMIKAAKVFVPRKDAAGIYERNYRVFKELYHSNKHNFAAMDAAGTQGRTEGDE